ncbi:biotin carboxylase N-terminal domain-containing protein [Brevibacterium sp. JSBI002]|uniref:ATP-binding protein n=1 Tax=Brevibacterium sp. JSBI002 TaxID=2886045 RepID=UPI00222F8307|nr:biotin carboxylase N-terminal domain-containing protein [Brevibacterium sp. JSBI002]UZD62709.1 ATP-grasp domain-containing protein [Brevibacterium sp. JSBI002]
MNAQTTTRPITRVLVANRGEIARRVFAACRARGIGTAAVFSDADADAPFVAEADVAVRLPGLTPTDTYLRSDLVLDAARKTGADAIHPGYGFLSENADFARAVMDAGLTWIGPDPDSIVQMGSKVESKRLMDEAGVPILKELDPDSITDDELPVLVKASAGGGGRGMRVVEKLEDLAETVASASREAASAFGDPTVFCERYIPTGHHIEVQVFGDRAGNAWAVGERECSIQRRHQKIIEEAPSPLVERHGADMRERLFKAARDAVTRIGYVGAGTVEFLADADGSFFFLEMNTRLQVEHPVTECTTGLDLVGLQLDIASGGELNGEEPTAIGHAIEVRLYAEDPAADWAPQAGAVREFSVPGVSTQFTNPEQGTPAVRLDAGIESGDVISTHYDPMVAKIIGSAPTRQAAALVLASALERMIWDGPVTNADLLVRVLREDDFLAGDTATSYLPEHPEVFKPLADESEKKIAAIVAAASAAAAVAAGSPSGPDAVVVTGEPETAEQALAQSIAEQVPRPRIGGWRLFHPDWRSRTYVIGEDEFTVEYRQRRERWEVSATSAPENEDVTIVSATAELVRVRVDGVERRFSVSRSGRRVVVAGSERSLTLVEAERFTDPQAVVAPGSLLAPMPGTVIRVGAQVGDTVNPGQKIIWLEAMKMEHSITSDAAGIVEELRVSEGDQVDVGALLAVIADEDAADAKEAEAAQA